MAMDPVHDIILGLPVFTQSGEQIGSVKEVTPHAIKIDAPLQPDYWLSREQVMSFTTERVTLTIEKDHLSDYKRSGLEAK